MGAAMCSVSVILAQVFFEDMRPFKAAVSGRRSVIFVKNAAKGKMGKRNIQRTEKYYSISLLAVYKIEIKKSINRRKEAEIGRMSAAMLECPAAQQGMNAL